MTFGHLLKTARKRRGLTQEELADRVFVSIKTVQFWEQRRRLPRLPIIPKIARALQMPTKRLLQFVALSTQKRVG